MIEFKNDRITYDYGRCQQCGACIAVCPTGALTFIRNRVGLADIAVDYDKCIKCQKCVRVCPAGKSEQFDRYFNEIEAKSYYLGYASDSETRRQSSSGGVCKTLIIESLKNDLVDGVYSLRKLDQYPGASGEFYTKDNIPTADEIPNSVYHSLMQCLELGKVKKIRRLMVIGTACQLKALEVALQGKFESIIKVCIFCKQQKTLDSTRFLAKISGAGKLGKEFEATYRGGGWPGNVVINQHSIAWHRAAQVPFGRRLWTVPGCNVCGDPFGFNANADISLMDPWVIREHNEQGETLVTVSTKNGGELLANCPGLVLEEKTYDEIKAALGIKDICRKQALIPYYRGEKVSGRVKLAAIADKMQKRCMSAICTTLPKMPIIFYRLLCKLPDLRNLILRKI